MFLGFLFLVGVVMGQIYLWYNTLNHLLGVDFRIIFKRYVFPLVVAMLLILVKGLLSPSTYYHLDRRELHG